MATKLFGLVKHQNSFLRRILQNMASKREFSWTPDSPAIFFPLLPNFITPGSLIDNGVSEQRVMRKIFEEEQTKDKLLEQAILNVSTFRRKKTKLKKSKRRQRRRKTRRLSVRKKRKLNLI